VCELTLSRVQIACVQNMMKHPSAQNEDGTYKLSEFIERVTECGYMWLCG